jgi:hypothetical protein
MRKCNAIYLETRKREYITRKHARNFRRDGFYQRVPIISQLIPFSLSLSQPENALRARSLNEFERRIGRVQARPGDEGGE